LLSEREESSEREEDDWEEEEFTVESKRNKTGLFALEGLREIVSLRSSMIIPVVLPTLLKPPFTLGSIRALAALSTVAGRDLSSRLSTILPLLLDAVGDRFGLFGSAVVEVVGGIGLKELRWVMEELERQIVGGTRLRKLTGVWVIGGLFGKSVVGKKKKGGE